MTMTTRIMVTGASGFVGRALSGWLKAHDQVVYEVDRQAHAEAPTVKPLNLLDKTATCEALTDLKPDVIFQAAGAAGVTDEQVLDEAHVETTRILLMACHQVCPKSRIVMIGSAAEYGSHVFKAGPVSEDRPAAPDSMYGRSKLKQTELARSKAHELGLDVICVRLFNTLGPGQGPNLVGGAMTQRLQQVVKQNQDRLEVFDDESMRDFLDVRDVARLLWIIAQRLPRGLDAPPVQIASGEGTRIYDLAVTLLKVAGLTDRVQLELKPFNHSTVSIGQPTTLHTLLHGEPIRTISLAESLHDMWVWQSRAESVGRQA